MLRLHKYRGLYDSMIEVSYDDGFNVVLLMSLTELNENVLGSSLSSDSTALMVQHYSPLTGAGDWRVRSVTIGD